MSKPTPETLRRMGHSALGYQQNAPEWLTPEYIADCMESTQIQRGWKPRAGDWYLCTDLSRVMRIESLEEYRSEGQASFPGDSPIDSIASGGCDVYAPDPKAPEKLLK